MYDSRCRDPLDRQTRTRPVAYIYILFYSIVEEADMRLSIVYLRLHTKPGYKHTALPNLQTQD